MNLDGQTQGSGNRIDRDVVMRGANASSREKIIVPGPELVHGRTDRAQIIRNNADLGEADTLNIEPFRKLRNVCILRTAGEDLVADYQQGGGPDTRFGHILAIAPLFPETQLRSSQIDRAWHISVA